MTKYLEPVPFHKAMPGAKSVVIMKRYDDGIPEGYTPPKPPPWNPPPPNPPPIWPPPNAKAGPLAASAAPSAAEASNTPKRLIAVSSPSIVMSFWSAGRARSNDLASTPFMDFNDGRGPNTGLVEIVP